MDNIETIVIAWLKTVAGDYEVHGDIPKDRPDKFITMDRTGGPRESMVLDRAEILIEVYDRNSRLDCSQKANEIGDRVIELLAYDDITRAKVNSTVNLGDPIGSFQRYQVYVDVWYRRDV